VERELKLKLDQNPSGNIAIMGFFSNYPVEDYFVEGNSAIIFGTSDHLWAHISSTSEKELKDLLNIHHSRSAYYFSIENWMIPLVLRYGKLDWIMTTHRYFLDDKASLKQPKNETVPITPSHSSFIYEHSDYKDFISTGYIDDRLKRDISAGIIRDGKPVAWGFTHDDGALGFLHVMPDFRKQGLGRDVLLELIRMRRKEKKPVFLNIVPGNTVAVSLVKGLGFKFDREASWLKLK